MRNRIGGAILALAAVFGIFVATATTTQAQWRNDDGRYNRRRDRDNDDRTWRRDRSWRDRYYRNDRYNRNDRYGNRRYDGRYRNDGYSNGRYGNGGYNNNAELNRGYQQGIQTGASDGQRGQSYNPQRSRHYRNARSQAFLQGFVRGYDQGYRQYAGYGNGRYSNGGYSNGGGIADILGSILGRP